MVDYNVERARAWASFMASAFHRCPEYGVPVIAAYADEMLYEYDKRFAPAGLDKLGKDLLNEVYGEGKQ